MKTQRSKKFWLILMLSGVLLAPATSAWARDRNEGYRRGGDRGHREVVVSGHNRYHYRDGRFYRPWWFGFEFVINAPPVGVVVSSVPVGCRTVMAGNRTYYYYDNVYYQPSPSGYVVVAPPDTGQAITINVPNNDGSFTPVTLAAKNGGYVGPQGEYYAGHPTVDQLKVLYGK